MSKRALVCVGAMVTVLGPASATAAPDTIEPFPITDPSWEPEYWGLGQEPDVQGAFNTPTILFVNFDGGKMNGGCGNDSHNDCSTITNGEILPFPGDDSARAAVMQAVRADVEDFGVIAVGERPPDSQPYAMVMVGEPAGGGMGSVGGVAPGIDCGNSNPNITSFCFLTGGSNIVATVVHQEAAHTWGLEHVDDEFDNLYPTAGGATDPKYNDQCSKIVSDTDLNPTSGQCNQVHTMFCDSGYQNSYQEMLALFGPPVADTTAPTVTIDSPTDGQVLDYSESFDLIITLDDDRRPQVLDTIISFDDAEVLTQKFVNKTLTFPITGGIPPPGTVWATVSTRSSWRSPTSPATPRWPRSPSSSRTPRRVRVTKPVVPAGPVAAAVVSMEPVAARVVAMARPATPG